MAQARTLNETVSISMDAATLSAWRSRLPGMGVLRKIAPGLFRAIDELTVTEKVYGTVIG